MLNEHIVERLIIYNRILKDLHKNGKKSVTSKGIAEVLSKTPAQVRRDLSSLGRKGKPGVGYDIENLVDDIERMLGLKQTWGVILMGAGNLGRALFHYPGFKREGFEFRMVVDTDPKKVGKKWSGIRITSYKDIKKKIKQNGIGIAVISVPGNSAQKVLDKLVNAGIKEILNFAPVTLNVPEGVNIRNVYLALELENLSYHLNERTKK